MSSGRLDTTYTWIKRQVEELASERSIQPDRAFAVWSMEYVYLSMDTDEALMQTDTLKGNGGGDGGLSIQEKSLENKTLEQLWSSIDASANGMLSLLNLEDKTVKNILLGNLT